MATKNFNIGPESGWVKICTTPDFLRVSGYPHTHPFFIFGDASATPTTVPASATGTATFSTAVPTVGQNITVGNEVYVFRAAAALPFEVTIGADFHASATNFTAIVNAQSLLVRAVDVADVVTLTAKAPGTQGNIALTKTASNVAVSGALLTGGTDPTIGVLVCHKPFWTNTVDNDNIYWVRVQNPVSGSRNGDGKLRLDVHIENGTMN